MHRTIGGLAVLLFPKDLSVRSPPLLPPWAKQQPLKETLLSLPFLSLHVHRNRRRSYNSWTELEARGTLIIDTSRLIAMDAAI